MSRFRILIVCTGNVCRSPFAERVLQHWLEHDAPGVFEVRSAGLSALVGEPMQPRSAALTTEYGADPTEFVSRQVGGSDLSEADVVLAMTRAQRSKISTVDPHVLRRTFTVRELARSATRIDPESLRPEPTGRWDELITSASRDRGTYAPGEPRQDDVVDPYRREDEVYNQMAGELVPALDILLAFSRGERVGELKSIERPMPELPKRRWWSER